MALYFYCQEGRGSGTKKHTCSGEQGRPRLPNESQRKVSSPSLTAWKVQGQMCPPSGLRKLSSGYDSLLLNCEICKSQLKTAKFGS